MSNSRDSWGKNRDEVDFDIVSLASPRHAENREEGTLQSTIFDSAPSTSTSSPEPRHPVITDGLPSAPSLDVMLPRPQQSHRRTVTDTPVTLSALPTVYGRPIYNLSDSISPPLSSDTPNTPVLKARPTRSSSLESFASYIPNCASPAFQPPFACPGSRATVHIHRIPSEDCRALSTDGCPSSMNTTGARGPMILYRLSAVKDGAFRLPPSFVYSTSGDSIICLSPDSKYPAGFLMTERGLVAYSYDPSKDDEIEDDTHEGSTLSWRGFINVSALVALIGALICLFLLYPVYRAYTDHAIKGRITRSTRINVTEQVKPSNFDTRAGLWEADIRV